MSKEKSQYDFAGNSISHGIPYASLIANTIKDGLERGLQFNDMYVPNARGASIPLIGGAAGWFAGTSLTEYLSRFESLDAKISEENGGKLFIEWLLDEHEKSEQDSAKASTLREIILFVSTKITPEVNELYALVENAAQFRKSLQYADHTYRQQALYKDLMSIIHSAKPTLLQSTIEKKLGLGSKKLTALIQSLDLSTAQKEALEKKLAKRLQESRATEESAADAAASTAQPTESQASAEAIGTHLVLRKILASLATSDLSEKHRKLCENILNRLFTACDTKPDAEVRTKRGASLPQALITCAQIRTLHPHIPLLLRNGANPLAILCSNTALQTLCAHNPIIMDEPFKSLVLHTYDALKMQNPATAREALLGMLHNSDAKSFASELIATRASGDEEKSRAA